MVSEWRSCRDRLSPDLSLSEISPKLLSWKKPKFVQADFQFDDFQVFPCIFCQISSSFIYVPVSLALLAIFNCSAISISWLFFPPFSRFPLLPLEFWLKNISFPAFSNHLFNFAKISAPKILEYNLTQIYNLKIGKIWVSPANMLDLIITGEEDSEKTLRSV